MTALEMPPEPAQLLKTERGLSINARGLPVKLIDCRCNSQRDCTCISHLHLNVNSGNSGIPVDVVELRRKHWTLVQKLEQAKDLRARYCVRQTNICFIPVEYCAELSWQLGAK